jgi:hAT family C-terminal dimerisation region
MCERAVYLRKAIEMYIDNNQLTTLRLSKSEWDKIEYLVDLLLPFKRCNQRIESTSRPGIERVFWIYETLFNELDRLMEVLEKSKSPEAVWIEELQPALEAMRKKLSKYYGATAKAFVYGDAVILDPHCKLQLFKQPSWDKSDLEEYSEGCRTRFNIDYQGLNPQSDPASTISKKRPYSTIDDDDYEQMLSSLPSDPAGDNEYDQYCNAPRLVAQVSTGALDVWRTLSATSFPRLGLMVRNTFAVPATGAGVERQFSRSGKVETKLRARIHPETTCDIMMYKDYLANKNKALSESKLADLEIGELEESREDDPPDEWRAGWFKARKSKKRIA